MAVVFREVTKGYEPTTSYSLDVQEVTRVYQMYDDAEEKNRAVKPKPVDPFEVQKKVAQIQGTTLPGVSPRARGTPGGAGTMQRVPPWCDAANPTLFAESVSVSVRPDETYADSDSDTIGLAIQPGHPHFAAYACYLFTVRYASRPYPILPDAALTMREVDFWGDSGEPLRAYVYNEHLRYCWAQYKAMDTRLQASQASGIIYRAQAPAGTLLAELNRTPFSGVPEMAIDDTGLSITVMAVPQRYIDSPNSYLRSLKGRINQLDWWRWKRACLLYLGFNVIRTYTPFRYKVAPAEFPEQQGSFATEQLVDLSLEFILTSRKRAAPPVAPEPTNPNFLAEGHNLLPNVPAKIYLYASGNFDNPADRVPSYRSYIFDLLLMDPDANLVVPR